MRKERYRHRVGGHSVAGNHTEIEREIVWTMDKTGDNIAEDHVVTALPGLPNRRLLLFMTNKIQTFKSHHYWNLSALFCICVAIALFPSTAFAQWNEQVLYSFQGGTDGLGPVGRIVLDKQGNLYGATANGASATCPGVGSCGTVYELSPPGKNGDPWKETILHVFKGLQFGDGAIPEGGLVMDAAGNLYGTTAYDGTGQCKLGGLVGCGTVYEMSPPPQPGGAWTETVLYSFQGGNDGYFPWGDLVFDKSGNLYGATSFGGGKGTNCGDPIYPNCGTIFELSPPQQKGGAWTEKVLYSFQGLEPWSVQGDGSEPNGGLALDEAGNIYGTTNLGGTSASAACNPSGCGTVLELTAPSVNGGAWTEKVLHRFLAQPSDGAGPNGNLLLVNGSLYGTTRGGGSHQAGVVYELEPGDNGNWTETFVHIFSDGSDGAGPSSLIQGLGGTFYGTADGSFSRGGIIFQLQPPLQEGGVWNFVTEYNFSGANGYDPVELSAVKGRDEMYGSTMAGGTGPCDGGCGTVFGVKP
jgi:uncharacterized repeat protein (TIGR03803 family)